MDRRAVVGGLVGVTAGAVGTAVLTADDAGGGAVEVRAADVPVEAQGELLARDVQAALVDVYGRTDALARLHDLRVAHEVVDDLVVVPGAWTVEVAGEASVVPADGEEGGVALLRAGPGAAVAVRHAMSRCAGFPVTTNEWRLRLPDLTASPATVRIGALDVGVRGLPTIGAWFTAASDGLSCTAAGATVGERLPTAVTLDVLHHRLRITFDGVATTRFSVDDHEVARAAEPHPDDEQRYGFAVVVDNRKGTALVEVGLDWFYLRRELPR